MMKEQMYQKLEHANLVVMLASQALLYGDVEQRGETQRVGRVLRDVHHDIKDAMGMIYRLEGNHGEQAIAGGGSKSKVFSLGCEATSERDGEH